MTAKNFEELRNIVRHEMPEFMETSYAASPVGAWHTPANQTAWPVGAIHDLVHRIKRNEPDFVYEHRPAIETQPETPSMTTERRMVRVIVVDADEQVPTSDALLFDSKELFTDKTDQELFFEIGIQGLLNTHNDKRTKIVNKTVKDRTEHLEPARIRDLKMLVITLAKF